MVRLPRSPIERQSVLNRSMLGLSGGGRSAVVSPEPRPLATLGIEPAGGDAVAIFSGTTQMYSDLPDLSKPDPARHSGVIYEVTFAANVAPSDDLEFEVFVNAVSVGTFVVPAGEGVPSYTGLFDGGQVVASDAITLGKVSGGTAAEDVTIKIAAYSDTGVRGSPGPVGSTGPQGPQGDEGPQGPAGDAGVVQAVVAGAGIDVDATDPANPIVSSDSQIAANRQTGSYTLVLSDAGKVVEMNVAGSNNLTVPPNSSVAFPTGTTLEVLQYGAGATTVVAGVGVTVRVVASATLVLAERYAAATLRKIATDEWILTGQLA